VTDVPITAPACIEQLDRHAWCLILAGLLYCT